MTASVLVMSVIGGLCYRGLTMMTDSRAEMAFIPLYLLGFIAFLLSASAYGIGTILLIMIRFYKNFFTDEAYLTFTLPVKRSTLFNSKLLTAFIFNTASGIVTLIVVTVFLAIAPADMTGVSILSTLIDQFKLMVQSMSVVMNDRLAAWITAYAVGLLVYIAVYYTYQTLLLFSTVTFGSLIVKRHKVLFSILIYYGANVAITMIGYIVEVVLSVGIQLLTVAPSVIAGTDILWLILGILVFYICMLGLASAFFYKFAVKKLRGNLNLA